MVAFLSKVVGRPRVCNEEEGNVVLVEGRSRGEGGHVGGRDRIFLVGLVEARALAVRRCLCLVVSMESLELVCPLD